MQCDVTRCIICISNKVEYLDKEHSSYKKFYQIVILSNLCNEIKKTLHKI